MEPHWTETSEFVLAPPNLENTISMTAETITVGDDGDIKLSVGIAGVPLHPYWQDQDLIPLAYPPPWIAQGDLRWRPVGAKEVTRAYRVALDLARALIEAMREDPGLYQPLRRDLNGLWLTVFLKTSGGVTRSGAPFTEIDRTLLATMATFKVGSLLQPARGESVPRSVGLATEQPIVSHLWAVAPSIRARIRRYLKRIGIPPHLWAECIVFGLLLHPQGIAWVRAPFNLGPRTGDQEIERGVEYALGIPVSTYRTANKFHRAFLKSHGVSFLKRQRGAKPGKARAKSDARKRFEEYILDRVTLRKSPQEIAEDAEARRLYRESRHDRDAALREEHVRYVIRSKNGKKSR